MTMRDWDDEFSNGAYIPGSEALPGLWAAKAAAFRAAHPPQERAYGAHARQKVDLFRPAGRARGLVVFVHGGYWLAFGKSDWSHLAQGALERGWAVALPQYRLAPEASLPEMVQDVAQAIDLVAAEVEGPIRLAGHSAGGHLVTRMICADSPLAEIARLERVVAISGLFELRPLLKTAMNATLRLTPETARAESALLQAPHPLACPLTLWVGGAERPEFRRQSRLLAEVWSGLDHPITHVEDGTRHHFDVIDGLADPASPLTEALLAP
jgi:acetyl esterase/lipase